MREWLARLRDWLWRDRLDRELAEELRFHQQQLERQAHAQGIDATEGAYIARRRIGNLTGHQEAARERWSWPWLDHLQKDLRYALRGLRRSPAFTATVVLTLALGIGANAAMFNVVDRLMFRPLAYLRDPGTVHRIYWQIQERGAPRILISAQYARYLDLQKWTTSFLQLAGYYETNVAVGEGESARERRVGAVSASFFDFFDARPALGRFFLPDEDVTPRGADVAVLSHAFWQSEFGERDVRGDLLQVGEVRATIIGVAPPGFNGVHDADPPVVYMPITTYAGSGTTSDARTYFSAYEWGWMRVLVRRKPEVTREEAEADASRAFTRSWEAARASGEQWEPSELARPRAVVSSVRPGAGPSPSLEARTALWVAAVAAIVLLIACANAANLFLARALQRQRETAVRLALGVSRQRLVMQSIMESVTLALLGGAAALLVAQWAGAAIRAMLMETSTAVPVLTDGRTVAITLALALTAGVLVGLVPSLLAKRGDLAASLRGGVRGGMSEGGRLRSSLLVAQATLSVVLLVGAALFVRSMQAVKKMSMGYDVDRVLLVNRVNRGQVLNDSAQLAMRRLLMATAQSLPGVESVTWASSAPFLSTSSTSLFVAGIDSVSRLGAFRFQATTPDYFRTMGTRILRGRGLSAEDRAGAPAVAVVSESMARALWPGRDAIGSCFRMRSDTMPCTTVVGIAEDMVQEEITEAQRFQYYLSLDQYTRTWGNWMVLRLRGDPAREAQSILASLQRAMPGASYVTVRPLREVVENAQRSWRMGSTMFLAFGLLALIVAAVGLYGVISYNVAQRSHELGVRVALGAQSRDVVRLVVGQGARLATMGLGFGLLLAYLAAQWVQPLLFQQSARDPAVYGLVAALLLTVALLSSALPAWQATRADPNTALRSD
jgi:predicted permease